MAEVSNKLRSNPIEKFSTDDVRKMLKERHLFENQLNKQGTGIQHEYEVLNTDGKMLVLDKATGLIWQQSGSERPLHIYDRDAYIRQYNRESYAGYSDWRLPTLEEAMSLVEPSKKNNGLHIDPVFDIYQDRIWTADGWTGKVPPLILHETYGWWFVSFKDAICGYDYQDYDGPSGSTCFIRIVRSP